MDSNAQCSHPVGEFQMATRINAKPSVREVFCLIRVTGIPEIVNDTGRYVNGSRDKPPNIGYSGGQRGRPAACRAPRTDLTE
jgi:hypothetical protein